MKIHKGEIYAGAVCDGSLEAYVFKKSGGTFQIVDMDTANGAEEKFDLSYPRETVWSIDANFVWSPGSCTAAELTPDAMLWHTWINTWPSSICTDPFATGEAYVIYPQPILSDIAFDNDGSIVLGFMDRMGMQGGFLNFDPNGMGSFVTIAGGDIIRICKTASGFAPEGSLGCVQNDKGNDVGYVPAGGAATSSFDDGAEYFQAMIG